MAAEAKKVQYEYKECWGVAMLRKKPDFFKAAYAKALGHDENNSGKTPIWKMEDGRYITESAIVVRHIDYMYSDETKHGKPLLPKDPYQRAAVEIMADWFGSCGWIRLHYGTLKQVDPIKLKALVTEWKEKWKILEQRLSHFTNEGMYLPDGRLSFFECIAWPFFERLAVIEAYRGLDIYNGWMKEFPRIKSWYEAMVATDAVQAIRQKPQYLIDGYMGYKAKGERTYAKERADSAKAAFKMIGIVVGGIVVGAFASSYVGKLKSKQKHLLL